MCVQIKSSGTLDSDTGLNDYQFDPNSLDNIFTLLGKCGNNQYLYYVSGSQIEVDSSLSCL